MANLNPLWVDRIFAHLSAMYGNKFSSMWHGTHLPEVKALWAEKLGGFADNPQSIKEALASFDEAPWPPTLPEFVTACRTAAKRTTTLALPPPDAMPKAEAAALLHDAQARIGRKPERHDPLLWAKKLKTEYTAGVCLLPIQVAMASEALNEKWAEGRVS